MKYKLKTQHSRIKRFQKTKTGKILYRKAFRSHILEKKSQNRKRSLRKKGLLSTCERRILNLRVFQK